MSKKVPHYIAPIKFLTVIMVFLLISTSFFAFLYFQQNSVSSKPAFLFVLKANKGTLKQSQNGEWKLTIINPDKGIVYFADRPYSLAGEISSQKFIMNWSKLGFSPANPPNAALSINPILNKGDKQDTIIVTLENPIYDPRLDTVEFTVQQSDNPSPGLQSFKKKLDKSVPGEFNEPSLFIDLSDMATSIESVESFNSYTIQS